MASYYLDTSAWVKRYVRETGSAALQAIFKRHGVIFTASLAYAEMYACFARLHREGLASRAQLATLGADFEADWAQCTIIEFTTAVRRCIPQLVMKAPLRGADAVHLASAVMTQSSVSDLQFITSDQRLLHAASDHGLQVWDPALR